MSTGAIVSAGDYAMTMEESDTTTDGDFTTVAAADLKGAVTWLSVPTWMPCRTPHGPRTDT